MRAGDQKLMINLEWPSIQLVHFLWLAHTLGDSPIQFAHGMQIEVMSGSTGSSSVHAPIVYNREHAQFVDYPR